MTREIHNINLTDYFKHKGLCPISMKIEELWDNNLRCKDHFSVALATAKETSNT